MTWVWLAVVVAAAPAPVPLSAPGMPRMRLRSHQKPTDDDVLAWVLALAAELRSGTDGNRALVACSRRLGVAHRAARAARLGGDVPAALRTDAEYAPLLAAVAAAWGVSEHTGAALADVLDRIADGHRRTIDVRRSLQVEVAGPRATARLMSALPVVAIGFAALLGADPLSWFLSSWLGLACLTTGAGLTGAGYLWLSRIVRSVEAHL